MSWHHTHQDGSVWVHDEGSTCETDFVPAEVMSVEPEPKWMVSVSATIDDTTGADRVYWRFCEIAKELRAHKLDYVAVSCSRLGEDEPDTDEPMTEFHDENTLVKVRAAIYEALGNSFPRERVEDIINSMQNYGILFRERNV